MLKDESRSIETDRLLVTRFLGKDPKAQNDMHTLLDRLIEKGLRALERKGSFFRDRDNIKQEIIVAVLLDNDSAVLRNFKGSSLLSTYLWSIIRFKLIDKLRQELLAAGRTEPVTDTLSLEVNDTPTELHELINHFLEESTEMEAFILRRRWLEDQDYETICRQGAERGMTMTTAYIGNVLFKKRNNLLQFLKKHGYEIDKSIRKQHIENNITRSSPKTGKRQNDQQK